MIVQMSGSRVFPGSHMALVVRVSHPELGVGLEPVIMKIEAVLDEQRPGKSVIPNAVTMNPGITERKRDYKQREQPLLATAQPQPRIRSRINRRPESHCTVRGFHCAPVASTQRE